VPSNEQLNTGSRVYVINQSRATDIHSLAVEKISNEYVRVQIHLQRYLGLRREEAIKFKPHLADHKTYIKLEASWCKGGRERTVPILSEKARYWINEAKKLAKTKQASLIPPDKNYIKARRVYDKQLQRAGVKYPHGFRHAYAHERYLQLTGRKCPACGGATASQLTVEQKLLDHHARFIISSELGHTRPQITVNYLGR
jgi:integrase